MSIENRQTKQDEKPKQPTLGNNSQAVAQAQCGCCQNSLGFNLNEIRPLEIGDSVTCPYCKKRFYSSKESKNKITSHIKKVNNELSLAIRIGTIASVFAMAAPLLYIFDFIPVSALLLIMLPATVAFFWSSRKSKTLPVIDIELKCAPLSQEPNEPT